MFNLKNGKGTYKGLIGECLFKLTRDNLIVTKFFNKRRYFQIFGEKLSDKERNFIENHWFSIDALEFDYTNIPRKLLLFEIKTQNKYLDSPPNWIPKMTLATHKMYNEALEIGFDVKIAIVLLCDNWEYDIQIKDFDLADYYIDQPKKYDKLV